jgi:hypothetical protein
VVPGESWANSWAAYLALMIAVAGAIWFWHSWRVAP